MTDFKPGDQVVFVPPEANGNKHHPSVLYGVVARVKDEYQVYCYIWLNDFSGFRNRLSSTLLPTSSLHHCKKVHESKIDNAMCKCVSPIWWVV